MSDTINIGDSVKFNESAVEKVRGKTGIVNKFLSVERLSLSRLEQGKTVYSGVYGDVNIWEIKLDDSGELYPSPEGWLDKLA